jgi:hypothetical protein
VRRVERGLENRIALGEQRLRHRVVDLGRRHQRRNGKLHGEHRVIDRGIGREDLPCAQRFRP